jgi:prepilin signal peptidase PulO-like enzyme (type II secretory pathway)
LSVSLCVFVRCFIGAATVTIPLASMLNGPVNGVTLVLVVVAARLLNVSFVNAFLPLLPYCLMQRLRWIVHHLLDCLLQL